MLKGLKLKARKLWDLIPTFVEVTGEKLVGGALLAPPSWIGLRKESESEAESELHGSLLNGCITFYMEFLDDKPSP